MTREQREIFGDISSAGSSRPGSAPAGEQIVEQRVRQGSPLELDQGNYGMTQAASVDIQPAASVTNNAYVNAAGVSKSTTESEQQQQQQPQQPRFSPAELEEQFRTYMGLITEADAQEKAIGQLAVQQTKAYERKAESL